MTITVYSTTTCPFCVMVKDWLKEQNIEFEDVNVGENQEKAQEMVDKSGQMGVPVVDIEGEIIVGFDKPKLQAALKEKGIKD